MFGAEDELEAMKKEVAELRQMQRTQADILQARKKEWDAEREALKEEKNKLEYDMYEMLETGIFCSFWWFSCRKMAT
jgi:TolA-binding protein